MSDARTSDERCVCGAVIDREKYTICTRCKRNIVPLLKETPTSKDVVQRCPHGISLTAVPSCHFCEASQLRAAAHKAVASRQWDPTCECDGCTAMRALDSALSSPVETNGIRQLFNKGIGVQNGNKFSFSFETEEEANRAFHYIADLGTLETSRSPLEPRETTRRKEPPYYVRLQDDNGDVWEPSEPTTDITAVEPAVRKATCKSCVQEIDLDGPPHVCSGVGLPEKPSEQRCHFMAFRQVQFQCTKPEGHDGSHSCRLQPETQPLKASERPCVIHGGRLNLDGTCPQCEDTVDNLTQKASEQRPQYYCVMEGCPGDHASKWMLCPAGDNDK